MSSFVLFLFALATLIAFRAIRTYLAPPERVYKRAHEINRLLNPAGKSLGRLLLARAVPNRRLINAFGLTNTFVSGDARVHRTFTTRAKTLIGGSHTWRAVALSAESTAHQFLPVRHIDLDTYIQCVTFSVVLSALFGTNPDALHFDDVVAASSVINQRWMDSKLKDATAIRQDSSLRQLIDHLDRWIVDRDQYPNPLNFILPAYETMWRVVAVTVAYVYRYRNSSLHGAVVEFGRDPTEERFQAFGEDGHQPSMQSIVYEVLRLHPPTKHIARASSASGGWWEKLFVPAIEIADVEAVHLSDMYGEKTSEFDPMRFQLLQTSGQPAELYSFGYGKLRCVAATWAPMAAAIIAAKVVGQIEEGHYSVTVGRQIGRRSGWDGWAIKRE